MNPPLYPPPMAGGSLLGEPAAHYATAAKKVVILAGPNGAGKTTFAAQFLPREGGCFQFVNADHIAMGMSPFNTVYRPLVDAWTLYDNSATEAQLLDEGENS